MFNSDLDLLIKFFGKTAMKRMIDECCENNKTQSISTNNSYKTSNHRTNINTSVELRNCKNVNVIIENNIYRK